MRLGAMSRYRPARATDGAGGFTEAAGTPVDFYGAVQIHNGEPVLTFRHGGPLLPLDLIETDGAFYRVLAILGPLGAPYRTATIERISRPIFPRPAATS